MKILVIRIAVGESSDDFYFLMKAFSREKWYDIETIYRQVSPNTYKYPATYQYSISSVHRPRYGTVWIRL